MSENLSDVEIGPYSPGDEQEIVRVFNKVFRQERTLDVWNWQFAKNPEGIHCFLAKLKGGRVLSQFVGIPRRMKVGNKTGCFAEIVDSFTDPEYRLGLKKPGLFASTCYAFVDHFGRPDREVIMYGLPNPPAFRVGSALLGYVHLYDVHFLSAASEPGKEFDGFVEEVTTWSSEVDSLAASIAERHDIMTIRDARYLNWRYSLRPDVRYRQLAFRDDAGHLYAAAVLRSQWLSTPVTAVAELMMDPAHPRAKDVVAEIRRRASVLGDARVQVFVRPDSMEWMGLAALGFVPEPSQFKFVARTYDAAGVGLDWLKSSWAVSLGDFDIV